MAEITLNGEVRTNIRKGLYGLRQAGKVPGIFYGQDEKNIPLSVEEQLLRPLYKTSHTNIINLVLSDGSKKLCILRDVQFDPVTEKPVHFDLYGLKEDKELATTVPVVLKGTAQGVRDGGLLQHSLHRIRISCLPKDLPDQVELAVEGLMINQAIHVKDLNLPNVTILENPNSSVVGVVPPTVVKEAAPAAVEGAPEVAEPEVIAKGKKTEEGEEGAAKA